MTLSICLAVPMGPSFDPRCREALQSIRDAATNSTVVNVAFLDCGDSEDARRVAGEFSDIVKYARHGRDTGQAAAIDEGWASLEGELVGWLNVDDTLEPSALATFTELFELNPHVDVVYGQSNIVTGQDNDPGTLHPNIAPPSPLLYRSNIISQPSCLIRRRALDGVGGINPDLEYTMDWDLWVRLMEQGHIFLHTEQVLSTVYHGRDTKTGKFDSKRATEIWEVARRNCSRLTAAKTIFGFVQNHITTYTKF